MICMDGTIPAPGLARGAGRDRGDVAAAMACRLLQCVSCRRRQSASPDHFRRHEGRRAGNGPRLSAPISCACASRWAACSPASMASGIEKRDLMTGNVLRAPIWTSSTASNAPSTPAGCSIPARCFPPCRPVSSRAICMCAARNCPSRICRASDDQAIQRRPDCGFRARGAGEPRAVRDCRRRHAARRGQPMPMGDLAGARCLRRVRHCRNISRKN